MSNIITEQVFGGKIKELVMLYEADVAEAQVESFKLAELPVIIYNSLFDNDEDLNIPDGEEPFALDIFRVIKQRIRSKYWFMVFDHYDLGNKLSFEVYKSICDHYDEKQKFTIPDFNVKAIEQLLRKYNIAF